MRIGVDAGGTFTDFVVLDDNGSLTTFKVRSDPKSPSKVILAGLKQAAGAQRAEVIHGSTVATNALLERKGVRTAFVTTAGFEDLLEIARQNRAELYNLTPAPRRILIPRDLCFGVHERVYEDGTLARAPSRSELKKLAARLKRAGVRSIAICFLHSYRSPVNEQSAAKALDGCGAYLCASHEISPEFREYERASTTVVNAYVGPLMEAYLGELERARQFRIAIMQSNGGFLSARDARRQAVRTVLSGPAGGVIGALETARLSGFHRVLGFDMGGTSTDVSLADGAPRETTEASVDGLPIRIPMLDIHTVGAGGGSIARVDAGGLLRVGPESAGADPGPACYGTGTEATVTDAHVVLGRLEALLGGSMPVDAQRAAAAVDRIAERLRLDRHAAAAGILRVGNANMERAIRVVSVERGHDPRDFALVAFGGCGGLHACEIARELGIATVIVPEHAGALSALGMLMADAVRDYSQGVLGTRDIESAFVKLEQRARRESPDAAIERSADLRYRGQSYELNVPWSGGRATNLFHGEHAKVYGYSNPGREVEIVTLRVRARIRVSKPRPRRSRRRPGKPAIRRVWIDGSWRDLHVWKREQLGRMAQQGPGLVLDYGSTTLIPQDWRYFVDAGGNLTITYTRR
ncbi:MAG: hydantoinase/oxoprolinase family protein [Bryobacterales bacterium]|nr:hydantoinase/oxoprolinase family protein [Bryobacterales bacterium]MBV9399711.1 hydantoinase/oxoprolinase family protein [Bryobacterales bacterium]